MPFPVKTAGQRELLEMIGKTLNVRFEEHSLNTRKNIDAWYFQDADEKTIQLTRNCKQPCFVSLKEEEAAASAGAERVEFSQNAVLAPVLRKRTISGSGAIQLKALPAWLQNITVLAYKETLPIWAVRRMNGHLHHYISSRPPEAVPGEPLFTSFNRHNFVSLLPLLTFLKSLTDEHDWKMPGLRACFMFDDPNLHWPRYGYLDFHKLAKHAADHHYHAAFATIPLDLWLVHKAALSIFNAHPRQISLLIHGVNHVSRELARPCLPSDCVALLKICLQRIQSFERRTGLSVSRIMAPPHGACNENYFTAMSRLGFEGATISLGSLRKYNGHQPWNRTLGVKPIEMIDGLPIFPRLPLASNSINDIIIAALINQAVILVGHHRDLAEGLGILEKVSDFINGLSNVKWSNMERIARSQYAHKISGKYLRLRMLSKRIAIIVPEGIREIWVQRPWLQGSSKEDLAVKTTAGYPDWSLHPSNQPVRVLPGQKIEIASRPIVTDFTAPTKMAVKSCRAFLRRMLTEGRDRTMPMLSRRSG